MEEKSDLYFELSSKSKEKVQYFFLENILKARIELHLDSGQYNYDEEVNMYLANLLLFLLQPFSETFNKPYISPYDYEVNAYLEQHPDVRTEYVVYKENADFGLISNGVFITYLHKGSYWHKVISKKTDSTKRISIYYQLAASALSHLRGSNTTYVNIFYSISEHVDGIIKIIKKVATDYFDFIEKLSDGSIFHLEKELADASKSKIYSSKIDDFLKAWEEHKKHSTEENKKRLIILAKELKELNPNFNFDENMK
jgi:hypothetical protein